MQKKSRNCFLVAWCLLAAFTIWTALVCVVDVRPIGPNGSYVGFATANLLVHRLTGVHMSLYTVTDWLGLVPIGVALGFSVLGLAQWIRRKYLLKVDRDILILGGFYVLVAAAYILFELIQVNCRPVLIDGHLETSYPSSTTVLVLCVMPTACAHLARRFKSRRLVRIVTLAFWAFAAFMVIGRTVSGVHWVTDIIGGILLSAGLLAAHASVLTKEDAQ